MRLVNSKDVLDRASVSISGTGPTAAMLSTLDAVSVIVENLLDTPLAASVRLDIFNYEIPRYRVKFKPLKFYLSQAFMDSGAQALEVRYADTTNTQLTASGQGTVLDPKYYIVDETRGIVTLLTDPPEGYRSVSFYYGAGFASADGMYSDTPEWLKEAAIATAVRGYETWTVTRSKKDRSIPRDELSTHMAMLINNHYRRDYDCLYSELTVVDP